MTAVACASTRRVFLLRSTALGSAMAFGGLARALDFGAGAGVPWAPGAANPPRDDTFGARFLTPDERAAVEAITARLIPSDGEGPGAREANVADFIDRQLAGFYGRADRWYMDGPFPEPLATQGYQAPFTPAALWRAGLAALDAHCRRTHGDRGFTGIDDDEQDALLGAMEEGEIDLGPVPAASFFDFMMKMTVEGYFCDPVHGGNREMVAWAFVGFPGARYDWRDHIGHNGARIETGAPVGLAGGPTWRAP